MDNLENQPDQSGDGILNSDLHCAPFSLDAANCKMNRQDVASFSDVTYRKQVISDMLNALGAAGPEEHHLIR